MCALLRIFLQIFEEIRRILKPGGVFLWGNALPTRVWEEADVYFSSAESGFDLVHALHCASPPLPLPVSCCLSVVCCPLAVRLLF